MDKWWGRRGPDGKDKTSKGLDGEGKNPVRNKQIGPLVYSMNMHMFGALCLSVKGGFIMSNLINVHFACLCCKEIDRNVSCRFQGIDKYNI